MTQKPTAGVSVPTLSQVMRGTGRISQDTMTKVLDAAKSLRYIPNSRAAAMRSGESREIGFVINQLANPFNAEVISGVVDLLEAEGYLVSTLDTRDDAQRQGQQLEAFIRNGRGGLLWVPALDTPPDTVELLRAHQMPTVTFLRPLSANFDHVGIRNFEATAAATTHLADLGHHHIAYFGGTDMTHVRQERIAGYTATMARRELAAPIVWPSADRKSAGLEATLRLKEAHPETTAIVSNGAMVALGACLALNRLGLTPGREFSVVGFDDVEEAAFALPPLTTMAVCPALLGRKLGRVILDRIREPTMPPTSTEVSAALNIRETTGTPVSTGATTNKSHSSRQSMRNGPGANS